MRVGYIFIILFEFVSMHGLIISPIALLQCKVGLCHIFGDNYPHPKYVGR